MLFGICIFAFVVACVATGVISFRRSMHGLFSDLTDMPLPAVRCPQCGHNLSNYSQGECPTCGLPFRVEE